MIRSLLACSLLVSGSVFAQSGTLAIQGSDTLARYVSDMIIASGLETQLVYQGGGSGLGEAALVAQTQALAPMSRAMKPEQLLKAKEAGLSIEEHVIGLDGIGVFVNVSNTLPSLTLANLKKIYSCEITNWKEIGGADLAIKAYRRNDDSGTTDAFKSLVGIKTFGTCVTALAETSDIAVSTSTESNAIGYSGQSAVRPENRELAVAKDETSPAFLPTAKNIRSFNYPLARKLYVYASTGKLSSAEQILLDNILDRSFSDPILVDNEFYTVD